MSSTALLVRALACACSLSLASSLTAQSRVDVVFRAQAGELPPGRAVYLLGDLPELGGGDFARAIELARCGDAWRVVVALPPDTTYRYRYYDRAVEATALADPANATPLGAEQEGRTGATPAAGRRVEWHGSFAEPAVFWRHDGDFERVPMHRTGAGREPGESRWHAVDVGRGGRAVEFYIAGGGPEQRDPATGSYRTELAAVFVQDGELFSYVPAAAVAPPRRDYDPSSPPAIRSEVLDETRSYRVLLPRGYDAHVRRRYPVLYAHDAWLWFDDREYSVDRDGAALAAAVAGGAVGEMIVVGVGHSDRTQPESFWKKRFRDFVPPGDWGNTPFGMIEGRADRYAEFVIAELKPLIDARYRTLPDREHTWTTGFSAGGLVSGYLGWDHHEVFGAAAAFAGAFEVPKFLDRVAAEPRRATRFYLDCGTINDYYPYTVRLYTSLIAHDPPWVVGRDLRFVVGIGHTHNTRDVAKRFAGMLPFLWPATAEQQSDVGLVEAAAERLAPGDAAKRIAAAVGRASEREVIDALRDHGPVDDRAVVAAVARALGHDAAAVRRAALVVLRYHPSEASTAALLRARRNARILDDEECAAAYYLALGQRGDDGALPILLAGIGREDAGPRAVRAALLSLGRIRSPRAVDALVRWLGDGSRADERPTAAAGVALSALTGREPAAAADWAPWWKGAKRGFEPVDENALPPSVASTWTEQWRVPSRAELAALLSGR